MTTNTERDTVVLDLDRLHWESIKQAANESNWIPKDFYFQDDWVSDVCSFLRGDHLSNQEQSNG